ncbi:hypothetical protein SAMD00019534_100940 [Acytostelium subglobosum LB1]|uniref:hypothetical protein n=1 Tax=Acytostelium subglobosum LB1 TaxID=1410327 RepID=UPI00064510A1|nr:hypothetical protein SAMD00019534_100940 [Acytostelium subglobosum LB1]GAM26919.1 hypothetical protein SAMD00019534_100940 [Acytostelium subglobosum LB1]|eukprot:XP_012750187.1 hypothetical protein SAMD00019534_100940 [Acytostelium subglobosum LB1]
MQFLFDTMNMSDDWSILVFNNVLTMMQPFDLRKLKNVNASIEKLPSTKLFMMVKTLSPSTFLPDFNDMSPIRQAIEIKTTIDPIYYINHSILINIPSLIPKICKMLKLSIKPTFVPPSLRLNSDDDDDEGMSGEAQQIQFNDEHIRQVFQQIDIRVEATQMTMTYLNDFSKASYQTELLVFLFTLASGPRKLDVLSQMQRYDMVDILFDLFKSIDWQKKDYDETHDHANPFYMRKIQAFRMIFLFVDLELITATKTCYLISKSELEFINSYVPGKIPPPQSRYWIPSIYEIYTKTLPMKERNFLTYCIQSTLRIPNCKISDYYASCGLIHSLFKEVTTGPAEGYQMHFDLMGELVKNKAPYRVLNQLCRENEAAFKRLYTIMFDNIIEANVFIRSIMLANEQVVKTDETLDSFNNVLAQICTINNKLLVIEKVILSVSPTTLCVENLCCVNSVIITLMLAKKDGQLDVCFESIKRMNSTNNSIIGELLELFTMWKEFYMCNTKDVFSLQSSSKLCFHDIRAMVNETQEHLQALCDQQ